MISGVAVISGEGRMQPGVFPGRWSPRRSIPFDIEPAATAAAIALTEAGWWQPGTGKEVAGGLVIACDGASLAPALRFARELRDRPEGAKGPSDFLFSLPSSVAATLGLLFGLTDYQSTLVGSRDSAVRALRHATDLIALGRVPRILFVALSVTPGERSAVAWCLDPLMPGVRYPVRIESGFPTERLPTTISAPSPAANGLLRDASTWLLSQRGSSLVTFEASDAHAWIRLEWKGN